MSFEKYLGFYVKPAQGLAPVAVTTSGNGAGFDRSGYSHAVCLLEVGAFSAGTLDLSVQTSDVLGSGYVDLTPAVIFANGDTTVTTAKFAQITTTSANSVIKMDLDLGNAKQYIRFVIGAPTGITATFGVIALLGQKEGVPPGA